MSVASIIDPTTGKIRPEYIPPGGGGAFLALAGGTMDASPAGVINAHTIEGLITLEGTPAGSLLDTTILTNTGNDLNLTTDVGDAVNVNSGNMIIGLNNLFEVNATANTRIVADGATDEVKLKATTFTFEGVPASAPALANVLAYDTGTGEVKYQPAGGGGGGVSYETIAPGGTISTTADVSILTGSGTYTMATAGGTNGLQKTIIYQGPSQLEPFTYTGSNPAEWVWFAPSTQQSGTTTLAPINGSGGFQPSPINKIIYKGGTEYFILGSFLRTPDGVTDCQCVCIYDTATKTFTALGSGLDIQTSQFGGFIFGGGAYAGYWDAGANRLYVGGNFYRALNAGSVPVADTLSLAYYDFTGATWVAMGAGGAVPTPWVSGTPYVVGQVVSYTIPGTPTFPAPTAYRCIQNTTAPHTTPPATTSTVNTTNWIPWTGVWESSANNRFVQDIIPGPAGELFLTGNYSYTGVSSAFRISRYIIATDDFSALGGGLNSGNNGRRLQYDSVNNRLYVCGNFTGATPTTAPIVSNDCWHIVYYDLTSLVYVPFGMTNNGGIQFNGDVRAMYVDVALGANKVYAVGSFTRARNNNVPPGSYVETPAKYVAIYDETTNLWSQMGNGFLQSINSPEILKSSAGPLLFTGAIYSGEPYGTVNQGKRLYGGVAWWNPGVSTDFYYRGSSENSGATRTIIEIGATDTYIIGGSFSLWGSGGVPAGPSINAFIYKPGNGAIINMATANSMRLGGNSWLGISQFSLGLNDNPFKCQYSSSSSSYTVVPFTTTILGAGASGFQF